MDAISEAFCAMRAGDRVAIDQTVNDMVVEFKKRGLWEANTYRIMRFRLLNGNYKSSREKEVLIRFIDELKKVLVS